MDTEPRHTEFNESALDALESLNREQLCRAADVQLVHAMLKSLTENNKDAREFRINKLIQSIETDKERVAQEKATGLIKTFRHISPAIRWGMAAMIIISLIFLPSNKAMATMDQMIAAIEKAGDRTYSIIVRDQKTGRRERAGRYPVERRNRRERYRIKYLGTVPVEQDQETSWTYLHATRPNRRYKGPRVIRIWAHPDTGLLRRIEFADIKLQGDPESKKLIVDLRDQKQLAENWFTHTAHHPEDADVDVLSEE